MKKLYFEDCVIEENKLYFFNKAFNGLFMLDLKKKTTTLLTSIPGIKTQSDRLVFKILKNDDDFYLIPCNVDKLWIYNRKHNTWKSLELENRDPSLWGRFLQAVIYKGKLYMIGSNYPAIAEVDLCSYEIKYYTKLYESLKGKKEETKDCYIRTDYARLGSRLYMASCVSNHILLFDMDTKEQKVIEVGEGNNRYAGIAYDGEKFWISSRTRLRTICWNGQSVMEQYDYKSVADKEMYGGIMCCGDKMVLPSICLAGKSFLLDSKGKYHEIPETYGYYVYKKCESFLVKMKRDGMLTVESDDCVLYNDYCCMTKDDFKNYSWDAIVKETEIVELTDYLHRIAVM